MSETLTTTSNEELDIDSLFDELNTPFTFLQFLSTDGEMKHHRFDLVRKFPTDLDVNEVTYPIKHGGFTGVCVGRDGDGYFVASDRARSFSFPTIDSIPDDVILRLGQTFNLRPLF
jgi:hypothetical protein